jgi:adenine-specific DNA-methyltransferase
MNGTPPESTGPTLTDGFLRISCGVATGADDVFVLRDDELPSSLRPFAFRTISGRAITQRARLETSRSMLVPYARNGTLLPETQLGALGEYLRQPERRARLMERTCVSRKPWYAFHESPPLVEILRPKILCKDIGAEPRFVVDETGDIVPRHSVYYLVPSDPSSIHDLCDYLNSSVAREWLVAHCQRAANGFVRLQSHVLKQLPLPEHFVSTTQLAMV